MVKASFDFISVLSIREAKVNCPTAPLKLPGLSTVGNALTSMSIGCDFMSFFTLVYDVPMMSPKKFSNGS